MGTTAQMVQFVRNNSFGILFSYIGQPMATHLPFIIEESPGRLPILRGHFAKANPHWRRLWETEVLVVFSGPHSYISPTWYQRAPAVPTWNYAAVHIRGRCTMLTDTSELHILLTQMMHFYEPDAAVDDFPDSGFYAKMAQAVVGFNIEITQMDGALKMSQNRSVEDVQGVMQQLRRSPRQVDHEVAELMDRELHHR